MQRARHQFIVAFAILAVGATSAHAQRSPEDRGKDLISQHCAMCHAMGGSGTSPDAKAPPLRSLTQRGLLGSLESSLENGSLSGHPQMPAFLFQQQDVSAILRYLRSIQDP
jgi:mono/diheme cytochrome c family protein